MAGLSHGVVRRAFIKYRRARVVICLSSGWMFSANAVWLLCPQLCEHQSMSCSVQHFESGTSLWHKYCSVLCSALARSVCVGAFAPPLFVAVSALAG